MLHQQNLLKVAFCRTMQRHTMLDCILNADVGWTYNISVVPTSTSKHSLGAPTQCRKDFLTRTLAERPLACTPKDQTSVLAETCYCHNFLIINVRCLWCGGRKHDVCTVTSGGAGQVIVLTKPALSEYGGVGSPLHNGYPTPANSLLDPHPTGALSSPGKLMIMTFNERLHLPYRVLGQKREIKI